ncbi:TIR domain-containing protein [Actinosynnema sp. NPDC059335]|uniref:TIR domain-containing protein n=1 Tax=Actinosynnema sp. NPDC059335 TaxID=3346804 RepID=UPI00366E8237
MEKRVEALGPTGERVSARIAAIRRSRRLTLGELAAKLDELGRPIQLSALSKIEKGQRRVDADDLVALALALDVSTNALLLPDQSDSTGSALLTSSTTMTTHQAWEWATRDRLPTTTYKGNSIFISYAHADGASWANWVATVLQRNGYRVMLDDWDLTPGTNLVSYITEAISTAAAVIVVMTEAYLSSTWTQAELQMASMRSQDTLLLPVRVNDFKPTGFLGDIVALDLTQKSERSAVNVLVDTLATLGLSPRKSPEDAPWPMQSDS